MSIIETESAFVVPATTRISLSKMFAVTASASNPLYLILTGLDRNEYTMGATGATGTLSGSGKTVSLTSLPGSDGRSAGIVFYQTYPGVYYNATYGYLNQLTYTASGSLNDIINLSLFSTSDPFLANTYARNPYALMQASAVTYLGSVTVATQPGFSSPVPAQATPNSIASVAMSFVGRPWNINGCWVLASTIAAEAGAGLPVQSTIIGPPGKPNGEWIVAFNGPTGENGDWQSMVRTGDIVLINTASGGHVTTCVSGSGATAMLVDNVAYVDQGGHVTNLAKDGSNSDITIAAPHLASVEWAGVKASSVVIYRLDTPVMAETEATATLGLGATLALQPIFSVADPAGKPITEYQIYDSAAGDKLAVNGTLLSAHSAATAASVASLGSVCLAGGSAACTDTINVRAFNGSYWGDWETLTVSVGGTTTLLQPPKLAQQTANQTWIMGSRIAFTLPANTFADPQGQKLTYTASQANGQALPSWLSFNASTETFTGSVPITPQTLNLRVTATDTGGLSTSETFTATVQALPPMLAHQTAGQVWMPGQSANFLLPKGTFIDPQGSPLTYSAFEVSGANQTSWMHFNPTTQDFTGTAPKGTSGTIGIKVVATDAYGLSASEVFGLSFGGTGSQGFNPGVTNELLAFAR